MKPCLIDWNELGNGSRSVFAAININRKSCDKHQSKIHDSESSFLNDQTRVPAIKLPARDSQTSKAIRIPRFARNDQASRVLKLGQYLCVLREIERNCIKF